MQFQEKKKGEKQKSEYFQTQWRKHVDKLTIPPKQTPVYLAVSKEPSKKKHRTGEGSLGACRLKKKEKKKKIQYSTFVYWKVAIYSFHLFLFIQGRLTEHACSCMGNDLIHTYVVTQSSVDPSTLPTIARKSIVCLSIHLPTHPSTWEETSWTSCQSIATTTLAVEFTCWQPDEMTEKV